MKNYKKIDSTYIDEVKSQVTMYEHVKSGARILTFENEDPNKVFMIGFRTPPINSCGLCYVPLILDRHYNLSICYQREAEVERT